MRSVAWKIGFASNLTPGPPSPVVVVLGAGDDGSCELLRGGESGLGHYGSPVLIFSYPDEAVVVLVKE